jgi:hypothetical protein
VEIPYEELDSVVPLQGMLGYLNFSEGKPDARFQKQISDAHQFLTDRGAAEAWKDLIGLLQRKLHSLQEGGSSAFRESAQAAAVLSLVADQMLPAYRGHHADLLFHHSDAKIFQPFFLARVFEAVLAQGPPWTETDRIVTAALKKLNDYVGHRPIAILETRPQGEPYAHERIRPVPLYIRGAGVAAGPYHDVMALALEILEKTDAAILADAGLDLELLDELAVDPRAYDQGHPVNRRPNYVFGEWDPHHLDQQGRFRRYVVRQITLDGLLARLSAVENLDREELLFEAAAVLAGTMLMAMGISGPSPTNYDSTATLATLMPRIAQFRDAFYADLLRTLPETHKRRLAEEEKTSRQPFGGARQHLNEYLARHRALQLQQRHLALLFSEMGYPEASRQEACRLPAASVRVVSEILSRLRTGQRLVERGELDRTAALLDDVEELLHRGIECGALADPWNILGFQAMFPLASAQEDSVRDTRIDDLVFLLEGVFNLYSALLSEAGAAGQGELISQTLPKLRRLSAWWDRFASAEVQDVRRLLGAELTASAEHVSRSLRLWHERDEGLADLPFWKKHLGGFRSPHAFARVIDPLLRKEDYTAAMGLLMAWLSQVEQIPLSEGDESFHALTLRWMLGMTRRRTPLTGADDQARRMRTADESDSALVRKFFDHLEANAEEYWSVPEIELASGTADRTDEDEGESVYEAAYEDVTFRDSADDEHEGAVYDLGEPRAEFELAADAERLVKRLQFLSTLARSWQIAAFGIVRAEPQVEDDRQALARWALTAEQHKRQLLDLLDAIHGQAVPEPSGSQESMIEFDRQRLLKLRLLHTAIAAALDMHLASGTLRTAATYLASQGGASEAGVEVAASTPPWEPAAMQIERALWQGDPQGIRAALPAFLPRFEREPLLLPDLETGGNPREILRVRLTQSVMRALVANLPRLGLLRETYQLLKKARDMEQAIRPEGRSVTEFNLLFQTGLQAVIEAVAHSASQWQLPDQDLVRLLEQLSRPFLALWVSHSQSLQISSLETIRSEEEWTAQREFVRRYGRDLFHARFMTLGTLRGILHRGMEPYLQYLMQNPDPLHPVLLVEELDEQIPRDAAERLLANVLRAVVENYEEYKDYNTTTAQSDYGENLHLLLDFLRLKASYQRQEWQCRTLWVVHGVLARQGRESAARLWQEAFAQLVREPAERHLQELARLEQAHGIRLRTIRDRLEERFARPLAVDRLCAQIGPVMQAASEGEDNRMFAEFQKELQENTAAPVGVGLDVPAWIRQLEQEVERVRAAATSLSVIAEDTMRIPKQTITSEELQRQLEEWEQPLATE